LSFSTSERDGSATTSAASLVFDVLLAMSLGPLPVAFETRGAELGCITDPGFADRNFSHRERFYIDLSD
jgi:hypothetical protein